MRQSLCSWFQYALGRVIAVLLTTVPAGAGAQSEAQADVRVTATILWNAFSTRGRTNNFDLPQFVSAPSASDSGRDGSGFGMTVRQTRFGVRAFWPAVGGAEVRAELDADFYGGQQQSGFGDLFPLARIRRAVVDVAWDRGTLLIGQEVPLIAEYNPTSLATVGLSGLSASGNLWLWLPQIRGGWRVVRGARARLDVEGALMAVGANEASGELLTQPDRVERSDRPAVQARAVVRWGGAERPGDVSVGAHRGWLSGRAGADSLIVSHAVAVAWRIPLGTRLSVTGEGYRGQALAGLGGGGVGQLLGPGDRPVRSCGFWSQAVVHLPKTLQLSAGGGVDDPTDSDLGAEGRRRNTTLLASLHWSPGPFLTALETRRLTTTYRPGDERATHINLAIGIKF